MLRPTQLTHRTLRLVVNNGRVTVGDVAFYHDSVAVPSCTAVLWISSSETPETATTGLWSVVLVLVNIYVVHP